MVGRDIHDGSLFPCFLPVKWGEQALELAAGAGQWIAQNIFTQSGVNLDDVKTVRSPQEALANYLRAAEPAAEPPGRHTLRAPQRRSTQTRTGTSRVTNRRISRHDFRKDGCLCDSHPCEFSLDKT
jgi:hypothetical protein